MTKYTSFTKLTNDEKKAKTAVLQNHHIWTNDWDTNGEYKFNIHDIKESSSEQSRHMPFTYGFMVHSEGNTDDWKLAGKTFGRLGSGVANQPENTTAFKYYWIENRDRTTYMYVSVFPSKNGATPKLLNYKVRMTKDAIQTDFLQPSRPAAAEAPDSTGARAIATSMATLALVAASLY